MKRNVNSEPDIGAKLLRVSAIVVSLVAVLFISVVPQVSNDFWLQAKVGQLITENWEIPQTILFSFTEAADAPFNSHEWMSSVLFHWMIKAVGEDALPLVLGLCGILVFAIFALLAYQRSGGNWVFGVLGGLLAICVENQRHYLRPELVSLILLGCYWNLLEAIHNGRHKINLLLAWLIVVIWTNAHGSFILAPIIPMIYALGSWADVRWSTAARATSPASNARLYLAFSAAAFLATLVNPKGVDLWRFVLNFGYTDPTKVMVAEWLPTFDPRWRLNRGFWIGIVCAMFTTAVMIANWRKLSAIEVLFYLLFSLLAFRAIRFLVYLGMLSAYVLPRLMPKKWGERECTVWAYGALTIASSLILGMSMRFGNAMGAYPHIAVDSNESLSAPMIAHLNNDALRGNVLNSYELGAELVYRYYPRFRPSIDSRIDSYGAGWTALNSQLFRNDALLRKFVARYDVQYMLLNHEDFISLSQLPSWSGGLWRIAAMDRRTIFLVRV